MISIETRTTKKGIKRYKAIVGARGQRVTQTFPNKIMAKDWAKQKEAELINSVEFPERNKTLGDLVERFINDDTIMSQMSDNHQKDTKSYLNFWNDQIGHKKLEHIHSGVIDQIKVEYARGRSGASVNRCLATLSGLFKRAVKVWKWAKVNPVQDVQKMKENERKRFLSESEKDKLLDACKASKCSDLYPLVILALSTGGRRSELTGLKWDHINTDRMEVIFYDTKNGSSRNLPLDEAVLHYLRYRKLQGAKKPFPTFPRKAWDNALERAGIKDFRFHDIRHTVASYMAMNGASDREIMAVGGWESPQMVGRYAHMRENFAKDAIKDVASILTKTSSKGR